MNEIRIRIKDLRLEMLKHNLDAWYISGTDPHLSEYLPEYWKTREFITGFTGSAGLVIVTQEDAGLWTDSRYFLQAEEQLKGTGIRLFKQRVPQSVLPEKWLADKLAHGSKVGFDPLTLSVAAARNLKRNLDQAGIKLIEFNDLLDKIWNDRPELPENKIFELDKSIAGSSRKEKIAQLIAELKKAGADTMIITALDDLAWMFNLRGSDIEYCPVFIGYGVAGKNGCYLFVDRRRMNSQLLAKLEKEKIEVLEYSDFRGWIKNLRSQVLYMDPSAASYAVHSALKSAGEIKEGISLIASMKAVKNPVELEGFRHAMQKDGAAMVEFLFWLKNNVKSGTLTEYTIGNKLLEIRSRYQGFQGESFAPIVGYKQHGAIVHWHATASASLPVNPEGILLVDSGAQFIEGTTDITRTIALGAVTEQQKTDYTLVLKGMIGLTAAVFPEGTKGCNLDVLARKPLWDQGLNYGHGTGHGVGHFLNVHEGPVSVRQECSSIELNPGMVMSNEPALYREGQYGIRIENLIVCVEKQETPYGRFLGFETLTLCPIDKELIQFDLLTDTERNWINEYHGMVALQLMPLLDEVHKEFLKDHTHPV